MFAQTFLECYMNVTVPTGFVVVVLVVDVVVDGVVDVAALDVWSSEIVVGIIRPISDVESFSCLVDNLISRVVFLM